MSIICVEAWRTACQADGDRCRPSVIIDHLRGDERAHQALRGVAEIGERSAASVMTRVEVLAGLRPSEELATRRLLEQPGLGGRR